MSTGAQSTRNLRPHPRRQAENPAYWGEEQRRLRSRRRGLRTALHNCDLDLLAAEEQLGRLLAQAKVSGVEQPAARQLHTLEVAGSSPAPAPNAADAAGDGVPGRREGDPALRTPTTARNAATATTCPVCHRPGVELESCQCRQQMCTRCLDRHSLECTRHDD